MSAPDRPADRPTGRPTGRPPAPIQNIHRPRPAGASRQYRHKSDLAFIFHRATNKTAHIIRVCAGVVLITAGLGPSSISCGSGTSDPPCRTATDQRVGPAERRLMLRYIQSEYGKLANGKLVNGKLANARHENVANGKLANGNLVKMY